LIYNIAYATAKARPRRAGVDRRHRVAIRSIDVMVCTGERGLSGAFNSSIVRARDDRAFSLRNQGQEVKFFCVGTQGI